MTTSPLLMIPGPTPVAPDVLAALSRQTVAHELIVCDSGSRDGSARLAREHGARVIEIEPRRFSHGGTRNMLLAASAGAHVALLTQDAVPAGERNIKMHAIHFEARLAGSQLRI